MKGLYFISLISESRLKCLCQTVLVKVLRIILLSHELTNSIVLFKEEVFFARDCNFLWASDCASNRIGRSSEAY